MFWHLGNCWTLLPNFCRPVQSTCLNRNNLNLLLMKHLLWFAVLCLYCCGQVAWMGLKDQQPSTGQVIWKMSPWIKQHGSCLGFFQCLLSLDNDLWCLLVRYTEGLMESTQVEITPLTSTNNTPHPILSPVSACCSWASFSLKCTHMVCALPVPERQNHQRRKTRGDMMFIS